MANSASLHNQPEKQLCCHHQKGSKASRASWERSGGDNRTSRTVHTVNPPGTLLKVMPAWIRQEFGSTVTASHSLCSAVLKGGITQALFLEDGKVRKGLGWGGMRVLGRDAFSHLGLQVPYIVSCVCFTLFISVLYVTIQIGKGFLFTLLLCY